MARYYNSPRITSEYMDCSLPLTFDQSSICSYGCLYCFAFYQKSNNPAYKKGVPNIYINVEHFEKVLTGQKPENPYYKNFLKHRFPLHWGGLTDPFDGKEQKDTTSLQLIKILAKHNYPTLFSTKGTLPTVEPYLDVFKKAADKKNFAFQFSIITNSDEVAAAVEPGVPSTTDRLKAMKTMSDMGYWTVLRLRPFILDITDKGLKDLVRRAAESGARAISTEFFCMDCRMNNAIQARYKAISAVVGYDIQKFYSDLSPSERGGYMRLNREIKREHMETLLRLCKKYNLQLNVSDPDFKELNMSGSCCGLPASPISEHSELHNWSRGQLTYFIAKMMRDHLKTGERQRLTYDDVMKVAAHNWMAERKYYGDSLKTFEAGFGSDKMDFSQEFRQTWNNTNSPGNPYNYFHGKLKPVGTDANKNIVYEYVPSPEEYYWHEEGLI